MKEKFPKHPEHPRLDTDGHEVPDPTPISIPAGFKRPETLAEQVQRLVRTHISREAERTGRETFEESEDFNVGDDDAPSTPYEEEFDPALGANVTPDELRRSEAVYRDRVVKRAKQANQEAELRTVLREALKQPAAPAKTSTPS